MILVVDDKSENIFALSNILKSHNFEVDTAASGKDALRKILVNSYSLIILDVQMPEMDGFEVAEMISGYTKSKHTPIIFLTALSKEKKYITKGYNAGAIDYITKPVDPDILILKVSNIYAMSQQRLELINTQQTLLEEIKIRKQAEDKLVEKNKELQTIMESIPQIAFTAKPDGKIDYVNKKWIEYFGNDLSFPAINEKEIYDKWLNTLKTNENFEEEIKINNKVAQNFEYFLIKIVPVLQNLESVLWVGTLTNITHQKLANEFLEHKIEERTHELLKKNNELIESNDELQQMGWILSHDLKEPIRKILTYGKLIEDNIAKSDTSASLPHLSRIVDTVKRMSVLINDLLNLSKIQAGKVFNTIDLNKVFELVTNDLEERISISEAKIEVINLPSIEAQKNHMESLFQNLISNAIKFAKPGIAPEIKITGEIIDSLDFNGKPSKNGNYCKIVFSDRGIGFEEQYKDKIFEVFQRLGDRKMEGTGMGLTIVKKIVTKHHGIITAKSNPETGSSFILILPLKQK